MILSHTNAGNFNTNWMENYGGAEAWIDVSGIANIFSIPALNNIGYHIKYGSDDGYYLVTNSKTDVATKFIYNENGLPYVEATKEEVMIVQTVRQNYEGFTNK